MTIRSAVVQKRVLNCMPLFVPRRSIFLQISHRKYCARVMKRVFGAIAFEVRIVEE